MDIFKRIVFAVACLTFGFSGTQGTASQYKFTHITTANSSLSYDGIAVSPKIQEVSSGLAPSRD